MKKRFTKIAIVALAILIALSSVSLGKVFAYFGAKSSASGSITMGTLSIGDVKSDGTSIDWNIGNLQPNQSFGGSYSVDVTSDINYYVRILFKASVTPQAGSTHINGTSCGDYVTDDTDILSISIDGNYSMSTTKTGDEYTAYYKLTPTKVTSKKTTTETFNIDLKVNDWVGCNYCHYYMKADVVVNMRVQVMQADYLEGNSTTGGELSVTAMHTLWSTILGEGTGGSTTPSTPTSLYTRINASGVEDSTGSYILFGYYPTTIKASGVTVGTTTDDDGYYTGSDGAKYAKLTGNPYDGDSIFSTGDAITSGTEYYFKVEQIKWRILSESNGTAMLLCESIIDACRYDDSTSESNNYANSEIRAFLNGYSTTYGSSYLNNGFLQIAFSNAEQDIIQTTEVDNSASTTDSSSNSYACANTNDKVYLLSYKDLINTSYGFDSTYSNYDTARRKQTTDYARANYAYTNTSSDYLGNGWWWSRSPNSYINRSAWSASSDGDVDFSYYVGDTRGGVVPALTIVL